MSGVVVKCTSVGQFKVLLRKNIRSLERQLNGAIRWTSRQAVPLIRERTPKAFGELRRSVHALEAADRETRGTNVVAVTTVSAPYAAAVEVGSRPHVVPLDVLVRWVKLRGMQGLTSRGRLKRKYGAGRNIGSTTEKHARRVSSQLKRLERGGALDVDAPTQIAIAIQRKIARFGIRPTWFVKQALPGIDRLLQGRMHEVASSAKVLAQ